MDAKDLAKAALGAIDDWLDKEIVGFSRTCRVRPSVLVQVRIGSLAVRVTKTVIRQARIWALIGSGK